MKNLVLLVLLLFGLADSGINGYVKSSDSVAVTGAIVTLYSRTIDGLYYVNKLDTTDINGYYYFPTSVFITADGKIVITKLRHVFSPQETLYHLVDNTDFSINFTASTILKGYVRSSTGKVFRIQYISFDTWGGGGPGNMLADTNGYFERIMPYQWNGVIRAYRNGFVYNEFSFLNIGQGDNRFTCDSTINLIAVDTTKPPVTITGPTAGAHWDAGITSNVTWTTGPDSEAIGPSSVYLSMDSGLTYSKIDSFSNNPGSKSYAVPNVVKNYCRFRVNVYDIAGNKGTSLSAIFSIHDITAPVVAVTSPNGAETWVIGSTRTITWTASDNVKMASRVISYSVDNKVHWTKIDSSTTNTGSYSWTLPGTVHASVFIGVGAYDSSGNYTLDASNAPFSLVNLPYFTSPETASVLTNGQFSYKIGFVIPGNPTTFDFGVSKSPYWTVVWVDSVCGTAPADVRTDTIRAILTVGAFSDTLVVKVSVKAPPISIRPLKSPTVVPGLAVTALAQGFGISVGTAGRYDLNVYNSAGQKVWGYSGDRNYIVYRQGRTGIYFIDFKQAKDRIFRKIIIAK